MGQGGLVAQWSVGARGSGWDCGVMAGGMDTDLDGIVVEGEFGACMKEAQKKSVVESMEWGGLVFG